MPVYLIREGDTDRVKIGWSVDPERRRDTFQTHHHAVLTIIRTIEGPRDTEKWMQHRFKDRRINREWFMFCPEMLTVERERPSEPKPQPKPHPAPNWLVDCINCEGPKQAGAWRCGECAAFLESVSGLGLPEHEMHHRIMLHRLEIFRRRRALPRKAQIAAYHARQARHEAVARREAAE